MCALQLLDATVIYARILRRADKLPLEIPKHPGGYTGIHQLRKIRRPCGLTSRGWYYPRVAVGKSRFCTSQCTARADCYRGDQRSGQRRDDPACYRGLSLISRTYPEPCYTAAAPWRGALNGTYPREELMRLETRRKIHRQTARQSCAPPCVVR